jgi:hypothetical protein
MALVIEAAPEPGPLGAQAISVAHYGEQNGDLMRDPEMCFELTNPLGMGWITPRHHQVKPGVPITRKCARPVKTGNQVSGCTSRVHLLHIDAGFLFSSLSLGKKTVSTLRSTKAPEDGPFKLTCQGQSQIQKVIAYFQEVIGQKTRPDAGWSHGRGTRTFALAQFPPPEHTR